MLVMNYDSIFGILQCDHSQFLEPTPEYYLSIEGGTNDFLTNENTPTQNCKIDDFPQQIGDYSVEIQCPVFEQSCNINYPKIHKVTPLMCLNCSTTSQESVINELCTDFNSGCDSNCYCSTIHQNSLEEETDSTSSEEFIEDYIVNFEEKNTDKLKIKSANIIKNFLVRVKNKKIFDSIKSTIHSLSLKDPVKLLMAVNHIHALIFDRSSCVLIFRLDGTSFPPRIVYKLFTKEKILIMQTHANFMARKNRHQKSGLFSWYPFYVYKCYVCKSKVRNKKKVSTKTKKKKKPDNQKSWIDEIYG